MNLTDFHTQSHCETALEESIHTFIKNIKEHPSSKVAEVDIKNLIYGIKPSEYMIHAMHLFDSFNHIVNTRKNK